MASFMFQGFFLYVIFTVDEIEVAIIQVGKLHGQNIDLNGEVYVHLVKLHHIKTLLVTRNNEYCYCTGGLLPPIVYGVYFIE